MINKTNNLEFLTSLTKALYDNFEPVKIVSQLTHVFSQIFYVTDFSIFTLNRHTGEMRDFIRNWVKLDENIMQQTPYSMLTQSYKNSFIINNSIFILSPDLKTLNFSRILKETNTMIIPLFDKVNLIGFARVIFDQTEFPEFNEEFIKTFQIAIYQISSAILNYQLSEQMKINLEFYGSLKNIAKIIETQYDLAYVIPMIGEMIDRFVSEHLIYIFLKEENDENFKLVWPTAFHDSKIFKYMQKLTPNTPKIMLNDSKVGIFALISEKKVVGAIVAYSPVEKLSKKTIDYIKQLTNQAATTIQKAGVYAEILKYASFDALTNLNNRRQFEIRLNQEVATARRMKTPLSCIMIDIDHFKNVNDTYGHAVGDFVLKEVANIITKEIREYDIASRYGGEEFCILLPHTVQNEATIVAERLRHVVESTILDIQSISEVKCEDFNVTISMGVSQFEPSLKTSEQLYKNADKALYKAKKTGRNKVIVFSPALEEENLEEE